MIRITRFREDGAYFHSCLTNGPISLGLVENDKIYVDMPLRFWRMLPKGKIEICYEEEEK